jgi:hypothetical protein
MATGRKGELERSLQQLEGALARTVVLPDAFVDHAARLVEDKDRRVGDPVLVVLRRHAEPGVVLGQVSVQEAKLGDHPAALVAEQREAGALGGREFAQDGRRIVADPDQADPAPLELACDLLQLN